jgi:F-type H+-transporting ATPase subunit beta
VCGTVVDAHFDDGLPLLDAALACGWDDDSAITAVIHSHVGDLTVRAIAIDSTRGWCRGAPVACNGLTLRVPVGNELISGVSIYGDDHSMAGPQCRHHRPRVHRRLGEVYPTGSWIARSWF